MLQIVSPKSPLTRSLWAPATPANEPRGVCKMIIRALLFTALSALAHAETHRIVAERYYRPFSHQNPVLKRINPGDVVVTKTVDSGGQDDKDVKRHPDPGNALTGPFYIEGAQPGDAIRVRFQKMRLNRNWGYSGFRLGVFSLTPEYVENLYSPNYKPDVAIKGRSNMVRWELDLARNVATLRDPATAHVKLEFPAKPMLRSVYLASPGDFPPTSGPAGPHVRHT